MKDFIKLAMKGLANFTKEQIVSENSTFGRENDAGYFGEVRLIVQLLDLLKEREMFLPRAQFIIPVMNLCS